MVLDSEGTVMDATSPGPSYACGPATTGRAGFIPLIDCAVLLVAAEKDFAQAEGVDLQLSREASWSSVRDKLTIGHADCAHLLAGMAIASQLELGNPMVKLIAPMSLGLNGNAITVSNELWARMAATGPLDETSGPAEMGVALAAVIAEDRAAGRPPLHFGMVYPYSGHNYELRYWMAAAGIHPDRDIRLAVVPPPYMPDYLRDGYLDGFCVGEPWNSISVAAGLGRIVVPKAWLWRKSPEKVLGVRADWAEANPETLDALIRALVRAAEWADRAENRDELAAMLARPDYLDVPAELIAKILSGEVPFARGGTAMAIDGHIVFHRGGANFPWRSHAQWIYTQMVRWGQVAASPEAAAAAAASYQPEIYRRALRGTGATVPAANAKVEGALGERIGAGSNSGELYLGPDGFFDGGVFDPDAIDAYIESFAIHSRAG
jgi:ABC-type nitrate/sulfonate/bicarbonate transport system substrate-binding protein